MDVDVWTYVAAENEAAADAVLDRIDAKIQLLLTFPSLGVARDDIRSGFRMLVADEYLIPYRVSNDDIEIVRVLHGRRDLEDV